MNKQLHIAWILAVVLGGTTVLACGGNGLYDDYDANGLPDGYTILADGQIIGPDGEIIDDSGVGPGLDVSLPDGFTVPDGGVISDGGVIVDSGCTPPGITCSGMNPVFANTCSMGNLTSVNCTQQGKLCADGFGCVNCIPGSGSCNGNNGTHCLPDGSGTVTDYCDPLMGLVCNAGICTGTCANVGQSYIGCDYYAVTMANPALNQATFPFAISVSNTGQQNASVNVTGFNNYNTTFNVAAGAVVTQTLPWVGSLSTTFTTVRTNGGAYRIRSTQPITVYEFNPRDYQIGFSNSFTNDASLLLPANAMTGNYMITSWPTWKWSSGTNYEGLITLVATAANTTVKFTTGAGGVMAGAGIAANGLSTVTMNQGDVIEIAATANGGSVLTYGPDPSGATVAADKPVEVFGGSACTFIPQNIGYCDHIEEVIFPLETLRTDYLVVPPYNSLGTPRAYVKIVATTANTTLTYDPNVGGPASLANPGSVATFLTSTPFRVTANAAHPIIIGMYMLGEDNFQAFNPASGDPAMSAAVAIEQYRKDYSFFSPPNYAQNWVTVTALMNSAITVDGIAVGALTQIGNSGYGYKNVSLCANNSCTGVHKATSAVQFGIQAYGYGNYTSYWYPGGLDLKR